MQVYVKAVCSMHIMSYACKCNDLVVPRTPAVILCKEAEHGEYLFTSSSSFHVQQCDVGSEEQSACKPPGSLRNSHRLLSGLWITHIKLNKQNEEDISCI